ncbi:hypothetical protein FOVG_11506 [Fusarium oxysporum f. sp. pisi HDV247]|uniref:Uncharacterized protein n=1 Tax=Fusarium oxysporum f. sp. pisi HDV247 TaxID=1080344 RepID=W9PBE3_FUSOX|nr:hypothetical protein FOVG_11506 [Fusarium oxysporum f. sp. pisi HDV247]KAI8407485.1 hypothetical protein FOFC_12922 [Fusarium oxysporum]
MAEFRLSSSALSLLRSDVESLQCTISFVIKSTMVSAVTCFGDSIWVLFQLPSQFEVSSSLLFFTDEGGNQLCIGLNGLRHAEGDRMIVGFIHR